MRSPTLPFLRSIVLLNGEIVGGLALQRLGKSLARFSGPGAGPAGACKAAKSERSAVLQPATCVAFATSSPGGIPRHQ